MNRKFWFLFLLLMFFVGFLFGGCAMRVFFEVL